MQVQVEECKKLRRASACIRDTGIIHVKIPRHWPRDLKASVASELVERLQRKDSREKALLQKQAARQAKITIQTQAELETLVRRINAETFNVPLGKIQLGYAKYNHLAQVNLRTKTMTVSKYCLKGAPADALRYLIVHELAHYFESGHGPRFWALVGKHVPDYKLQSRIIKAFHHQAVITDNPANGLDDTLPVLENITEPPSLPEPAKKATKPARVARPKRNLGNDALVSPPTEPKKDALPRWAGVFKQLLLWGEH